MEIMKVGILEHKDKKNNKHKKCGQSQQPVLVCKSW